MTVDEQLHLLAYVSRSAFPDDELEYHIADIVGTAKKMNPKFDVTGVLFFHRGLFMQVIEGAKPHLEQLMHNISGDSRHMAIEVLIDEPVDERGFSDWNMDYFDLNPDSGIDPERLTRIAREYRDNLLPRGDVFVSFYKAMIGQDTL